MTEDKRKWMLTGLVGILIGAAIGLFIGWYLWPVEWINATPEDLRTDLQNDYMMMTIDSFRVNGDEELAAYRYGLLGEDAAAALDAVAPYQDPNVLAAFEQAVAVAKGADVVIAVIGELANMSGEAASRASIDLPGRQEELLKALVALGKPVVLVLLNGRPLSITRCSSSSTGASSAFVCAELWV